MKCYNHPDRDSVAICQTCGRALCHECAGETDTGIACHGKCTDSLLERGILHKELADHLKTVKRTSRLGVFFSVGMGILFIIFSKMGFGLVYNFIFLLGIGFTVYGLVALLVDMILLFKDKRAKRHPRQF